MLTMMNAIQSKPAATAIANQNAIEQAVQIAINQAARFHLAGEGITR
jgi:hypothetical protein